MKETILEWWQFPMERLLSWCLGLPSLLPFSNRLDRKRTKRAGSLINLFSVVQRHWRGILVLFFGCVLEVFNIIIIRVICGCKKKIS